MLQCQFSVIPQRMHTDHNSNVFTTSCGSDLHLHYTLLDLLRETSWVILWQFKKQTE